MGVNVDSEPRKAWRSRLCLQYVLLVCSSVCDVLVACAACKLDMQYFVLTHVQTYIYNYCRAIRKRRRGRLPGLELVFQAVGRRIIRSLVDPFRRPRHLFTAPMSSTLKDFAAVAFRSGRVPCREESRGRVGGAPVVRRVPCRGESRYSAGVAPVVRVHPVHVISMRALRARAVGKTARRPSFPFPSPFPVFPHRPIFVRLPRRCGLSAECSTY